MLSPFTRRFGTVLASALLGVVVVDLLLQVVFTLHLRGPLLLLRLPQLWQDPQQHENAKHYLLVYGLAAIIGGLLASAVLDHDEEPEAFLGHDIIEASLNELKEQGLLKGGQDAPARRRFWWRFWDAAKRDKR